MPWLQHKKIGNANVYSLTDGKFKLDGGSMFGVVPRNLWEKISPPDEKNRIQLRINPMLIQLGNKNILIETGMDDKSGEKFESIYCVERDQTIFECLSQINLKPEDIDIVINTHLHFDHAGRNQTTDGKPTFPKAQYFVQAQELHDATHTHERNRASYIAHNFENIKFETLEGEQEILPGLRVLPVPGHNLGQQAVLLESEGESLVYVADLIPTFHHAPYPFIMGFDLYPLTTLEVRKRLLPQWFERGTIVATPHDPHHAWGKLVEGEKNGFMLQPLPL